MAANTITGQEILFKVARDVRTLKAGLVTATSDTTHLRIGALDEDSDDYYNGALMRERGSTSIAAVSDYTGATREFTLATALAPTIGDSFEWCWWNATERAYAWAAINEAIRQSWGVWAREVEETMSSATLTFDQDAYTYNLPAAVSKLLRIGTQTSADTEPLWYEPELNWYVTGQEGAFQLVLQDGFGLQRYYNGEKLLLQYVSREPELTSETGTTQLPIDWFWHASRDYVENLLNDASRLDLVTANVNIPLIQRKAMESKTRLLATKPLVRQVARLHW